MLHFFFLQFCVFFIFVVVVIIFLPFKRTPKCGAEVLSSVPKCEKAVTCLTEKIHGFIEG